MDVEVAARDEDIFSPIEDVHSEAVVGRVDVKSCVVWSVDVRVPPDNVESVIECFDKDVAVWIVDAGVTVRGIDAEIVAVDNVLSVIEVAAADAFFGSIDGEFVCSGVEVEDSVGEGDAESVTWGVDT